MCLTQTDGILTLWGMVESLQFRLGDCGTRIVDGDVKNSDLGKSGAYLRGIQDGEFGIGHDEAESVAVREIEARWCEMEDAIEVRCTSSRWIGRLQQWIDNGRT